jgi:phage pi2 protein 07
VAICIVNIIASQVQYKQYAPVMRRIAEQLETTAIRVVDIDLLPTAGFDQWSPRNRNRYRRNENEWQSLHLLRPGLDNVRISADTLYIDNYENKDNDRWIFTSHELETVIIHEKGKPDEVFDYRPQ